MNRLPTLPLFVSVALLGSSCAGPDSISSLERETVAHHLTLARAEIERNDFEQALERLVEIRDLTEIAPGERTLADRLTRDVVQVLFDIYQGEGYDSNHMLDLFELELPRDLRATAGVLAAQMLRAEDHPVVAYRQIKSLDSELPTHTARTQAGEFLADLGLWLIRNPSSYYYVFDYRDRGVEALEYFVVNYPLNQQCDEAYAELAQFYEDIDDIEIAIERHEDLIIYHPLSPYSVVSSARLPYLRLARLERHDYDRGELQLASAEVDRWLERYPDHELAPSMESLRLDCFARLAENDLYLARYYAKIDVPFGARIHAERALEEATNAGSAVAIGEASSILAGLPTDPTSFEEIELEAPRVDAELNAQNAGAPQETP